MQSWWDNSKPLVILKRGLKASIIFNRAPFLSLFYAIGLYRTKENLNFLNEARQHLIQLKGQWSEGRQLKVRILVECILRIDTKKYKVLHLQVSGFQTDELKMVTEPCVLQYDVTVCSIFDLNGGSLTSSLFHQPPSF
jgi:hypothetical protein